jgi:uncharacterized lipoprotein YajG
MSILKSRKMKKLFIIAVIAAFASCSNDDNSQEQFNSNTNEYNLLQKEGDTLPDTGGQGGHLPPPTNP